MAIGAQANSLCSNGGFEFKEKPPVELGLVEEQLCRNTLGLDIVSQNILCPPQKMKS